MNNGFLRVASASPDLRVADVAYNTEQILATIRRAGEDGARLLVLPALALTGCTCGDLVWQRPVLEEAERALLPLAAAADDADMVVCVGLPLFVGGRLYNAVAVLANGAVLGIVPKSFVPGSGTLSEGRRFSPPPAAVTAIAVDGAAVPFGTDLIFQCDTMADLALAVEVGEDLAAPIPPSARHCLAGATVIAAPAADSEAVGRPDVRRGLVRFQSGRSLCGYVYAGAGVAESSGGGVFSGHNLVAECGTPVAESEPFGAGYVVTELDLGVVAAERARSTSADTRAAQTHTVLPFHLALRATPLTRRFPRRPFVPDDPGVLAARCREIFDIQTHALARRLAHTGCRPVLGVSGGSDSTLALLVCRRALQLLDRPASALLAVSMPCFGTTSRTRSNARRMSELLGATFREIDISDTVTRHLADIGHGGTLDVTYENAQARERTQVLMDLANMENGLVIGTGDMSEAALGWCTFNGDHMSMYAVNCSVPKTMVRSMITHLAQQETGELRDVLLDVVATPVSPELLPPRDDTIAQVTEDLVGPYELHDFFLYYVVRRGFRPRKLLLLAEQAFEGELSRDDILRWMRVFYRRFFQNQFKRGCVPDGPSVGSVSLSPADLRMPSDASSALWLREVDTLLAGE